MMNPKLFVFGKDQVSIPLDGTFLDANNFFVGGKPGGKLPILPTQLPGAKAQPDVQLYISQYTLQSAL